MKIVILLVMLLSPAWLMAKEVSGVAADFTLKSRSGDNVRLAEQRGNVVMINFWASWCGPCRQEMPHLEALYQEYADYGFVLLGVNVDENSELAERFLQQVPVTFPVLFDPTSSVSQLYKIDAMPTTVLVDRDGNLRYLHRAYRPGFEDIYREQIKALVLE